MNNKIDALIWGIVFIAAGILYAGNTLNYWDFSLFFDGWWTVFIIAPAIVSIFKRGPRFGNVFLVLLGGLLLLNAQDILSREVFGKLIFPIILVIIGVGLIAKIFFSKKYETTQVISAFIYKDGRETVSNRQIVAIFSGQNIMYPREKFNGAEITAIFGGVELDLSNAVIDSDITIDATCIFGGIDIRFPPNVNVKTYNVPIFGGVSNKFISSVGAPTVYVNATTIFGGIDIK
jgi:predicted membrane protein